MTTHVLVTYATKHGATAEIAERIGTVIAEAGLPVEVQPVDKVRDLSPYTDVVLGSAVYMGQWRKEAVSFLEHNEPALAEMDLWLFSSGPTDEGDPVELTEGWTFPEKLGPLVQRIGAHEPVLFHGVLDPETLNLFERAIIKSIKAPTGDFRDWEAIEAWAKGVAAELTGESK